MSAPSFGDLLGTLMSSDNSMRAQAETYFNAQLETSAIQVTQNLLQILADRSMDMLIRSFAGILLRRSLDKVASVVTPDVIAQLRSYLLQIWSEEDNRLILKRISHAMAQSSANGSWPDLLPSLIAQSQGIPTPSLISLLNLIEVISEYSSVDIENNLAVIGSFLGKFLSSPEIHVQIACAKASGACIVTIEDDSARSAFKPALEPMIAVLGAALSNGEEAEATIIMGYLVELAQIQPMFFKGSIDGVVSAMVVVAGADGLDFPTRSMALELLVTLTETAPALARRCPALIKGLVPLAMSLIVDVDEGEAEWAAGKYSGESPDENYFVGEEAVERAAAGMGGKAVAPPVLEAVVQYINRPEWQYRRAAVAAMARLAEGCTSFFKAHVNTAVGVLTAALSDRSARVQYEAIQMIGRLGALFPDRSVDVIQAFLPTLSARLSDATQCSRVRGHAASALISMVTPESCDAEILEPHLQGLLNSLVICLQGASLEVQSPCFTLLGCAAQVSPEAFKPFYASFMPGVKAVLHGARSEHLLEMRGKAMQCVGLLGEAVGDEVFAPDALEIMQLLLGAMGEEESDSDIKFDYILPACARISKALGSKFEPFLPFVMTPIFAGASRDTQFSMVDANEGDDEGDDEHDEGTGTDSAVFDLGGGVKKRVTLNTHAVQQKTQAAKLLHEFAANMKGNLKSFLSPALDLLLQLVTDRNSPDIRSSASLGLGAIFQAIVDGGRLGFFGPDVISSTFSSCIMKLLQSLKEEVRPNPRACSADSIRDVLAACYESGEEFVDGSRGPPVCRPDLSQARYLTAELMERCGESVNRRKERMTAITSNEALEAEDQEQFAEELEEEEELLANLVDALGQLLKLLGEEFMPIFDTAVAAKFAPYLASSQPEALQIVAVCMMDDAIEFGGSAAHKYIPQCCALFHSNLASGNAVLRQCSAYGLAQIIRVAPSFAVTEFERILHGLVSAASSPTAKEEENEGTTENAIFGLGCILSCPEFRVPGAVSWGSMHPSQVSQLWLQGLPLRADEKEARISNSQLCSALESSDATVLGENHANVPQIFRVFADVLCTCSGADGASPLAHPATLGRIRTLIKTMAAGCPAVVQAAFSVLDQKQQNALSAALA